MIHSAAALTDVVDQLLVVRRQARGGSSSPKVPAPQFPRNFTAQHLCNIFIN
jgi:hypothetical protein